MEPRPVFFAKMKKLTIVIIIFVILQMVLAVIGLGAIGVGIWLVIEFSPMESFISLAQLTYSPYLIIAVGGAVLLVAVAGSIGACLNTKAGKFILITYTIFAFIILLIQLVGSMAAFVFREQANSLVRTALNDSLRFYFWNVEAQGVVNQIWDDVQEVYECCGIDGAADWRNYSPNRSVVIPLSCCQDKSVPGCTSSIENAHVPGCLEAFFDILSTNIIIVASIGLGIVVFEAVLIIMAFILVLISLIMTKNNNNKKTYNNNETADDSMCTADPQCIPLSVTTSQA
jgi:hypothetical protein